MRKNPYIADNEIMIEGDNKGSFDRLVAGLTAEDRLAMLNRINQSSENKVQFVADSGEIPEKHILLKAKLDSETIFYRFYLWIRSLFAKSTIEQLYRDDLLTNIAKKIDRYHPGIVNHKIKSLDYIFYERLQNLKEAADFFKPYIALIEDNPGDFYVFLSTFVAPELSENINQIADPYTAAVQKDVTMEVRNDLLKKLDSILMNMSAGTKGNIYLAVTATNWLKKFTVIPYLHFLSQFTNVAGEVYSCPYKNAMLDYNYLASVFANRVEVQNEVIEALFLYSQRKSLNDNTNERDIEKSVKEFMAQASSHFSTIQSFVAGVPVIKLGRVVNNDYDWEAENLEGAEGWFPSFRVQWKKIIDIRWTEWVRDQKKKNLSDTLKLDFGLNDFPVMEYRPWLKLWTRVEFTSELTGGFLSWFATEKYNDVVQLLNDVIMEGVFYRNENRQEFTEGVDNFINANTLMLNLLDMLSPKGEYGKQFEDFSTNKIHSFQVQKQIDTMMSNTESTVREIIKIFGKGTRAIERVFHGFFDEEKDGIHEGLQNLTSIKGHDNSHFRDSLKEVRTLLRKSLFYLAELEPIDNVSE